MGERVRELRLAQRMTQEALAERAGLSYKFIGEIERGRGNPTIDTLQRLASALGLDAGDLLAAPARDASPDALYQIRTRDLQTIREALESAEALLDRISPVARPGRPSSRPSRKRPRTA